jgi:hypothetical protein
MSRPAPILLFTYKRLDTLRRTVSALQANKLASESDLIIFSDGPKNESEVFAVNGVRQYLKTIQGFSNVKICEASKNNGLANSIIGGVTETLKDHESVVVLEDDLITTPNFLSFLNAALKKYKNKQKVFSISGYSFDFDGITEGADGYFLNRGWSWGWATWKDRWEEVDWVIADYTSFLRDKKGRRAFAAGGSDLNKMLRLQMQGKLDSWAIRWFYNQYKLGGLTLYPKFSKVYNDGFDKLATHTKGSSRRYQPSLDSNVSESFIFPDTISTHPNYQRQFQKRMGVMARIRSKLETQLLRFKR